MEGNIGKIIIIIVSAVIVLTCTIFTIPFNTVPYSRIETYHDTEIKQEPYIATESYVVQEMLEREETIYADTPYSVPLGIRVPFKITHASTMLVGSFKLPALEDSISTHPKAR